MYLFGIIFIVTQFPTSLCFQQQKLQEAEKLADMVYSFYFELYNLCLRTSMPNQRFMADNLHNYINAFSKTTVGYAPQFTANRKFFANMINTPAFKNMLTKDLKALHKNILEKIKFCDESVITQDMLKQFYDREIDQTKV